MAGDWFYGERVWFDVIEGRLRGELDRQSSLIISSLEVSDIWCELTSRDLPMVCVTDSP